MSQTRPTEDDVLKRLREEAAAARREAYPGDLLADLRPRLGVRSTRPRGPRWLLAAAAAAAVAVLTARSLLPPLAPASLAPGMSPFRTVSFARAVRPPALSLSLPSTPSGFGRAMSLGAGALSAMKPPSRPGPAVKEER